MKVIIIFFPLVTAFFITLILGPVTIPFLKRLKFGQHIREQGPKRHLTKAGTPTMGGIIIILSLILTSFFFGKYNKDLILILGITLGFGLIGFIDDFLKIALKRALGLRANQKIICQLILATLLVYYGTLYLEKDISLKIPFSGFLVNLGVYFIPFSVFVIIGTVNSVNLTDGLDGLLAGITVIISSAYTFIGVINQNYNLVIFSSALTGAAVGFLVFNRYPAQVFMGDTGSLAIGGALASMAVLTKTQLYLPVFGFIFVLETLSVILQVISYRFFGKRIFKMSPLHHHFELMGWSEPAVVYLFWCITLISVTIGLISYFYI